MRKEGHVNNIFNKKINYLSDSASINYGTSFHQGHQANVKINTGEIANGDEFSFHCTEEENNTRGDHLPKKQKGNCWI